MAFQAPATRRSLLADQHQSSPAHLSPASASASASARPSPTARDPEADSEEWVVFSPSTVGGASTYVSGTNTLSRVSELGSILSTSSPRLARRDTFPGTFASELDLSSDLPEDEQETDEEYEEDGESEDDSLREFREMHAAAAEGPVMLPTHDGLGTFGPGLRSLEDSLRLVQNENASTNARIQKWRLEQSQAFIEEIERATRRRKLSLASAAGRVPNSVLSEEEAETASMSLGIGSSESEGVFGSISGRGAGRMRRARTTPESLREQHRQAEEEEQEQDDHESESLWRRLTRSFIRDIIGLDDSLLEVLFGESLPSEAFDSLPDTTPSLASLHHDRLLKRLARELGVLVNAYSPTSLDSPGAFSTIHPTHPSHAQEEAPGTQTPRPGGATLPRRSHPAQRRTSSLHFVPTLEADAAHWGVDDHSSSSSQTHEQQQRREYWEQDLSARLVFSFLKNRFVRAAPEAPTTSLLTQHPLVENHLRSRRSSYAPGGGLRRASSSIGVGGCGVGAGAGAGLGGGMKTGGKSLDSLSLSGKRSGFYWDVPSSVGSGKTGSCVGTGVWAAI